MNKRCIALGVAQGGLRSQRPARHGAMLAFLLAWSVFLTGCPASEQPPTPPASTEKTPLPATVHPAPPVDTMTLPTVEITSEHPGAKALLPSVLPELRANLEGVWFDGKPVVQLICSPKEGCPGWRDHEGWEKLTSLMSASAPPLIALDARLPADVAAALVTAAASGGTAATILVRSEDKSLHGLPVGTFPRDHGLLNPSSLSYRTTFFRGDLRTQRGTVDAPPAPSQPIRIRGGAIRIDERCGGVRSARLIRRNMGTWSACYRMTHERRPGIAGEVQIRFEIPRDGIPASVRATSTELEDPALFRCLEAGVQELSFPAQSPAGDPCPVQWDLRLESRKDEPPSEPERPGKNTPIAVLITPEGAQLFAVHGHPALQTGLNTGLGEGLKKRTSVGDRVVLVASPSIPAGALARAIAEAMRAGFTDIRLASPSAPQP